MWHNRGVGARIDLDELLVRGLTALLLAGYVAIVYVLVVAAGGLPEQGPHQDFAPPWWSQCPLHVEVFAKKCATFSFHSFL